MTVAEILQLSRENLQELGDDSLRDGYTDDPVNRRALTRLLPQLNLCLTELVWEGMKNCFVRFPLTEDLAEYGLGNTFTNVRAVWLEDTSNNNRKSPLTQRTIGNMTASNPGWRNGASGTPSEFYVFSNNIAFNIAPNKATFVFKAIADVMPTLMTELGDTPTELDELYHPVLVSGITYKIMRMKALRPGFGEVQLRIFGEHKSDWEDGKKMVKSTYERRTLSGPEISIIIDEARGRDTGGRCGLTT